METKIDLTKIKGQLPHGAQSLIAKRLNVSLPLVNKVINGKCEENSVLNGIADYLIEIKAQKNEVINKLASLID